MIELRAVRGPTGRLLLQLLREKGLNANDGTGPVEAIVSYGVLVHSELPTLNTNAGLLDKYQELQRLSYMGFPVPAHSLSNLHLSHPVLGRDFKHTRGRDVVVIPTANSPVPYKDYYVSLIPKVREYRVWAYRRKAISVYEKVQAHPPRGFRGRSTPPEVWNYARGYAFKFFPEAPENLRTLGAAAVHALGLDFGAVDVIEDAAGSLYVLEVNTAPGVEGRRQGIVNLATKIFRWKELNYISRKEE